MKKNIEVCAAVIKKEDRYFAVQRGPNGEVGNKWEFPGGKLEQSESQEAALIREIKEELGVELKIKSFMLTIHHEYKTFNLTMHAFLCEIVKGNITLLEDQGNFKWLTPKEMLDYDFAAADIAIIEKLNNPI